MGIAATIYFFAVVLLVSTFLAALILAAVFLANNTLDSDNPLVPVPLLAVNVLALVPLKALTFLDINLTEFTFLTSFVLELDAAEPFINVDFDATRVIVGFLNTAAEEDAARGDTPKIALANGLKIFGPLSALVDFVFCTNDSGDSCF